MIHLYTHKMQNYCVKMVFCNELLLKSCTNKTITWFKCLKCGSVCTGVCQRPLYCKSLFAVESGELFLRWPGKKPDLIFFPSLWLCWDFAFSPRGAETCELKAALLRWVSAAGLWWGRPSCHLSPCSTSELNYTGLTVLCAAPSVTRALTPAPTLPAKVWCCCCEACEHTLCFPLSIFLVRFEKLSRQLAAFHQLTLPAFCLASPLL